jgi:hypothetical protein
MRKPLFVSVPIVVGLWVVGSATARGDGGTVSFRGKAGPYELTVFTAPSPLRAGPVDVSVLVQDAKGEPLPTAAVTLALAPRGRNGPPLHAAATAEAATNKLLKSALFELPSPGSWDVAVTIAEGDNTAHVGFSLEVLEPLPAWMAPSWWDAWPLLAIAFYTLHQWRVARAGRLEGNGEPCSHRPRNWA